MVVAILRAVTWLLCCVLCLELCVRVVSGQLCAPKLFETQRWTLQIRQTDQGAEIVESTSSLSFDVIGQRLVSHETGTRNGQHYAVYYLYYYPAGVLYTVKDGVCTATALSGNITDPCFSPAQAHIVDFLTMDVLGGWEEGCALMGGIYYQQAVGSMYTFGYGGIPVFEGLDGEIDGVPTYTLSSYLNVTLGIADPTVFVPPDTCIKAQVSQGTGSDSVPKLHSVVLDL